MKNKGADQTVYMLRLVCACVVRMQQNKVFSLRGPNNNRLYQGIKNVGLQNYYVITIYIDEHSEMRPKRHTLFNLISTP